MFFSLVLEEFADVFSADVLQVVFGDDLTGFIHVVGAEDEDALSLVRERIEVGDADACLADGSDNIGSTTRDVVEFECEDIGECDGNSCCLQLGKGFLRLIADDAVERFSMKMDSCFAVIEFWG